jgi:predicted PurR-regulated permease PerM
LNALILLGMVLALYLGHSIFIPTVIALLLAAMLWPSADWLLTRGIPFPGVAGRAEFPWLRPCLHRLKVPWTIACTLVVSLLVIVAFTILLGIAVAIPKLLQAVPNTPDKEQETYEQLKIKLNRISPVPISPQYLPEKAEESQVFQYVKGALNPQRDVVFSALVRLAQYGGSWLWESILIMFLLLFLLLEGGMLTRRVVEIFGPSIQVQGKAATALRDMANQIRSYLVWRTIINFTLALFLGLVYYVLGLSQSWTWALFTAILWYVPYIGPILAGVPPVLDAFVSCDSPWAPIGILLFYVFLVTLEGYFIIPVVMGRSMEMNATTVMLACLFWELVWGPAGLFLAMPLMAAVKTICTHVPDWQAWANLMDTREEPVKTDETPALLEMDDRLGDTQILTDSDLRVLPSNSSAGWKTLPKKTEERGSRFKE